MSNEFKLVPFEPTEEMLNSVTTTTNVLLRAEIVRMAKHDWASMLAAAPQPPALDGERKIKTYECELPVLPEALTSEAFHMVKLDDHRAHLAPLQAELERLKNNVREVTTYRDNAVKKIERLRNELTGTEKERDQLKARRDELEGLLNRVISGGKLLDDRQPDYDDHVLEADINAAMSKPAGSDSVEYGPTPGCKQCEEAESCGFTDCPECGAQLCEDVNGDGFRVDTTLSKPAGSEQV